MCGRMSQICAARGVYASRLSANSCSPAFRSCMTREGGLSLDDFGAPLAQCLHQAEVGVPPFPDALFLPFLETLKAPPQGVPVCAPEIHVEGRKSLLAPLRQLGLLGTYPLVILQRLARETAGKRRSCHRFKGRPVKEKNLGVIAARLLVVINHRDIEKGLPGVMAVRIEAF